MGEHSGKSKILRYFLENVGRDISREKIIQVAGISEWARRVRELSQEGWDIETTSQGYLLRSATRKKVKAVRAGVNAKQRYRILHRDKSRCRRCGRTVDDGVKLLVDHIIPVEWGGQTSDDNLWTLCEQCNLGKKAWESDADAEAMKRILEMTSGHDRLQEYFKFKAGQLCTREELQIVAGIFDYARRIRELRAEGMNLVTSGRGDYTYQP